MPANEPDFRLNGHTIAGIVDAEAHFAITENNGGVKRETAGFDDWLAGFIAGDGYLGIAGGDVRLTLKLRADEAPVLAWIRECTGMGNICGPSFGTAYRLFPGGWGELKAACAASA